MPSTQMMQGLSAALQVEWHTILGTVLLRLHSVQTRGPENVLSLGHEADASHSRNENFRQRIRDFGSNA